MNATVARTPAADPIARAVRGAELSAKVAFLYRKRAEIAGERFQRHARAAYDKSGGTAAVPRALAESAAWWTDAAQRTVLFWDTLRQRGNRYVEHVRAGSPPTLHFAYETVLDARSFERPANYALVRIAAPAGVKTDPARRPYVIIDPRAGHGPGIGGFKDDSQVGVALRAGHPVYFVIFFPDPVPGQTLLDVTAAEREFVRKVRELHPASPKPVIIGNCQGGWATMMLAASAPEETGPLVINGAPMSYWGGAWSEGEGDNPMRYAGGLLGGTWMASLASDLGAGVFDGAHLVQNFENLNPANTFWDKYYTLYANVDTEAPRFLEFERWWGAYYLMNREEIEWITRNLFVGNQLWDKKGEGDTWLFDLKKIRQPIVLFASMGDNITPPQQAFNWVADVYGTTEEIKANGQVIVGLVHESIGHLGIFVSGKVAKKEYAQIVGVMESIEALPPGLYAMKIEDRAGGGYDVTFEERRLEDVAKRLNRFQRGDEQAFDAAKAVSEFNQRAYELFARPFVQGLAHEDGARVSRQLHPLRAQRWMFSDLNPWMAALGPVAAAVRSARTPMAPDSPPRRLERAGSEMIGAWLDLARDLRDAYSEALFFQLYGNLPAASPSPAAPAPTPLRDEDFARRALGALDQGGYTEAVARAAALLARTGQAIPLARLELKRELVRKYDRLLPHVDAPEWRRVRGEQEVAAALEPERALAAMPRLLPRAADRRRLLTLVESMFEEGRSRGVSPTEAQAEMLERLRGVLGSKAPKPLHGKESRRG